MQVSIKADASEVKRTLESVIGGLNNFYKPLDRTSDYMKTAIGKQFKTEGGHLGKKWKGLSERTQRERVKLGFPAAHPILYRTGHLYRSTKHKLSRRSLEISNNAKYFEEHQRGTSKIPQRQVLGLSREDERKIGQIFADWLSQLIVNKIIGMGL